MPESSVAAVAAPLTDLTPARQVRARLGRAVAAAAVIAVIWCGVRLALAARFGTPGPVIHDEFSILLGADTFAHGRLVNPPHAMSEFFESPQVLVRPVYASKYPPGQALFLAFGERIFGSPFYGVLAGAAFMIFTTGVMLSMWVPLAWSIVVTSLLAIYLLPPMYWVNSYYGGCVAAAGGALVLLAIGLHRQNRPALAGWVFGLGAMVLFFTRPYEGSVFTLAVLLVYRSVFRRRATLVAIACAAPVLIAGLLWTAHYNRAVTGNALEFPEMLYDQQYDVSPLWWVLPLRPSRPYSYPRLAALHGNHGFFVRLYRMSHPWWRGLALGIGASLLYVSMLAGPAGAMALVLLLFWRTGQAQKLAIILGCLLAALSIEIGHIAHYAAPGAAAVAILVAISLEKAWRFRRALVIALLTFAVIYSGVRARAAAAKDPPGMDRVKLIQKLESLGTPQLVFVHYPSPDWNILQDWVANGADIDHQKVIFAQDMGPEKDACLLASYPNRQAWLLSMQDSGYRLGNVPPGDKRSAKMRNVELK